MQDFIPGPEDKSILFEQENHISKEVWDGKELETIRCIPWDPKSDSWTLNTRMRQYFDWQPYDRYSDELVDCVNEGDRSLFRSAVTMVDRFLDWQLESFEKLEKMADASQMNSFVKSMQRKVETFKKAWSSGFVSFNVENCINSTFDEEGKADVKSPSPNTSVGSYDGVYGLSPNPHTSTHMFHSFHSTMTPIHVSTPQSVRRQIPVNLSTPQSSSKGIIILGGPDESSGQSRGGNKMGSIVGWMKANPRKATYIPVLKSTYYVPKNKREKVSRPNPKYCLSHAERSCLEELCIRLYSKLWTIGWA
ncbi:hypothetical protein MRB53_014031 [Persea americana]|uniref:Uncharacterized protein n=1 Tax=Persea americana TaxID=3435 RepID=A0ACC2K9M3_PERAE|nr:hypothetical protein MRB53_014031 [Persea americana]